MVRSSALLLTVLSACHRDDSSSAAGSDKAVAKSAASARDMIAVEGGGYRSTRSCDDVTQLGRYSIDRRPVGCAEFRACTAAGVCPELLERHCVAELAHVPRDAAKTFCAWVHADLPSVAEWQMVANAKHDTRTEEQKLNFQVCDAESPKGLCFHRSPLGMEIQLMQGLHDGEWTGQESCDVDEQGHHGPQLILLNTELDALAVPYNQYQEFRCVRRGE